MTTNAEIIEDLEFRSTRRIRLFQEESFPTNAGSHFEWLVCSSKYGIGLAVLPGNQLISFNTVSTHSLPQQTENDPELTDLPTRKINYFQENVQISFVRLSCNERVLAFGIDSANGAFVHIFDIFAFSSATDVQPFPLTTIKVSTENGKLTCLEWNPELEDLFTVGTTDGALSTIKYSLDNRLKISIVGQIQMKSPAMCLSWSRKGKQLSIGDANGHLHQLKPELTSVRVVDPPANIPNIVSPVQCAGIFWVATTDWLIVYRQANNPMCLTLAFLTVKKNQPPEWTFFGDLTFQRPNAPQFLDTSFHFVPLMNWNMIFMFAHRSPDFAVIGQRNGKWLAFVMDKYNITMPINSRKVDTYPIGAYFDFTSSANVILDHGNSESPSLPPQPILHVLSSGGLLLPYNICSFDQSRPSLQINAAPFSAQNVMNGPQPANFQPRPAVTMQEQKPVIKASENVINKPLVAESTQKTTEINQQTAQQIQTQQIEQKENADKIQAEFAKTLAEYSNSKYQLIGEFMNLSTTVEMLLEKSQGFDIDCIESLWELFEKVQYSLDDGVRLSETTSRKCVSLTAGLKQIESIWQKYTTSGDHKRKSIVSSSILEDLSSIVKRFESIDDGANKLELDLNNYYKQVTDEHLNSMAPNSEGQELKPISESEQTRINKVNDAIAKRVDQYSKKAAALQQQLNMLKFQLNKKGEIESPSDDSPPDWVKEQSVDVNSLSSEIQRLLLIVEGKSDFSPFSSKTIAQRLKQKPQQNQLTQRQTALNAFLSSRPNVPVQIRRVCPKKLVIDEKPEAVKTPLRNRTNESNDQRLQKQITAAREQIAHTKNVTASPNVSFTSAANLSFGSNVDSTAILNAAKSIPITTAIKTTESVKQPVETVKPQVTPSLQPTQQQTTQAPKTEAAGFSFTNLGKSVANEAEQQTKVTPKTEPTEPAQPQASNFSFAPPKKDDQAQVTQPAQPQASNFSFAPKKEDQPQVAQPAQPQSSNFSFAPPKKDDQPQVTQSAQPQSSNFSFAPKKEDDGLSSAFGGMSATGQQPVASQSPKASVAFSFNPSKPAEQSTPKSTTFPFAQKAENPVNTASPFGNIGNTQQANQPQTSTPVSFSFAAPKPDNQQKSSGFFGQNQQQSSGFGSGFGSAQNNENKSMFGSNAQANTGSGFSAFSQNTSSGFGQSGQQSTGFGQSGQQSSGFGQSGQQSTGFGQSGQQSSGFGQSGQQSTGFGQSGQQSTGFGQSGQQSTGFGQSGQQSTGFGQSGQQSGGFGSGPSFGGTGFGSKPTGFGSNSSSNNGGFSAFASKGSSFGQLAQQNQQQPSGFSSPQQNTFGSGFGSSGGFSSGGGFGSGSAFSTPQQNKSSAFTAFRK